ncbi:hypothetical protein [Corynebacterium callunae]|uniref:Uncharacterized protein n=1 Tax=Corynebacterium callunae DSM 20147 TaxID=1121353 RepID=M1UKX4_9CORY|nr:hypothetical protein [Corynebacterium callunae]AGG66649.1 hypothetical protein H924_06025 [Corynebacterium callunae DSM 20147]
MDDESGPIETEEVIAHGEDPGDITEATEANPAEDSVSTEESEDYSLIKQDDDLSEDSQVALEIEVVRRDDELMVFGDELAVREFIDSLAISAKKTTKIDNILFRHLSEQFKKSGTVLQGVSEIAENSGYYIKLTKESAASVKKLGLYETKGGITYAMIEKLGKPGKTGKWLQVDNGFGSLLTNPAVLSGVGGIVTQVALQQSLAEITAYLQTIDHKLDAVIKKVDEAKKSDLSGLLKTLREATIRYEIEGTVDSRFMNEIISFQNTVSAVESYAWDQTTTIREDLADMHGLKSMMVATGEAQREISQWLGFLANAYLAECRLDDFKLKEKLEESLEAYNQELDTLRVLQADRDRERATRVHDLYETAHEVAKFADKKLVTNRAAAEALNQRANQMVELTYNFAEAVQLKVDRESIPVGELGMLANFASRSIQMQRDELPEAALKLGVRTVVTHGPKIAKFLKEFDWSKIR